MVFRGSPRIKMRIDPFTISCMTLDLRRKHFKIVLDMLNTGKKASLHGVAVHC